jgi:dTMP kinase
MFITFEGIEGAGKTTQIKRLHAFLINNGYESIITREPGGTRIGGYIRSILLDSQNNDMEPLTELLLYTADRAQHIHEIIKPALSSNKTILCDRYFDATLVYQGVTRGINTELIKKLHEIIFDNLKPDVTFLLDLAPEIGLQRAWKDINNGSRKNHETRFENENAVFHEKIRAGYLELAHSEPGRFRIIDASKDQDHVYHDIIESLTEGNSLGSEIK